MQSFYYFTFVPMVYLALAIFVLGMIVQAWRAVFGLRHSLGSEVGPERQPKLTGALRDAFFAPSLLKNHPVHWLVLGIFHVAFALVFIGHLELIGEIKALQVVKHQVFLGGGVVGIVLFVAVLFFLFRRFHSPVREMSVPADYYMLLLLLLVILFGSQVHLARRLFDYDTVSVFEYREYLSSLFTFKPVMPEVFEDEIVGHSFLLALHVFCANLFLMLFPVSSMGHSVVALPLARLARR